MARPYIFFINPFLVATQKSYRRAKKLGDYSVAALAAQAGKPFSDLLNELSPLSQTFNDAYALWTTQRGTQKGKTVSLNDLIAQLSNSKIEDWDVAIQQVYKQHTPEYVALLPNRRIPFQRGGQESRINAVNSLSLAIGADVPLQPVKTDVDDFYTTISTVYNSQKGNKSTTKNKSDAVEAARVALCIGLYGMLGQLMDYYKTTPESVAAFIDLETLRSKEQDSYQSNLKGNATKLALTHTFAAGDQLRIINRGNTDIGLALMPEKNDPLPDKFTTVTALNEMIVNADVLGDISTSRFLIVKNLDATQQGAYTIELL